MSNAPKIDALLNAEQAAEYMRSKYGPGFGTKATLDRRRHTGDGPAYRRIGPRLVAYETAALDAYAHSRIGPEIKPLAAQVA